jgi:UDP-N-acetylmuramate dehydrogenase
MLQLDRFAHFVRENEPLAPYTWLGIGGPARYFAEPTRLDELQRLLQAVHQVGLPVRVLGGGSNLLVREVGVDGLVLRLSAAAYSDIRVSGNQLMAGGGAQLSQVIATAVGAGLAGLEHLMGIPGSLGGALAGNASTPDGDIGQRVVEAQVLTEQGELKTLAADQLDLGHRRSSLEDLLIAQATLQLDPVEVAPLTKRLQKLWIVKRSRQPSYGTPAAIPFVDPDANSAADLIELAGMHGASEGPVQLSNQYPGFLVAGPGSTSQQILQLIERTRQAVIDRTGVQLQLQLKIW